MRPALAYTLARFTVFALMVILLSLIGLRGFFLLLVALGLSMPISYLVLGRQRAAMTEWIENRRARQVEIRSKLRGAEPGDQESGDQEIRGGE